MEMVKPEYGLKKREGLGYICICVSGEGYGIVGSTDLVWERLERWK
jgi:hypothetical protein